MKNFDMKKVLLMFTMIVLTLSSYSQGNFKLKSFDFNYIENDDITTIKTEVDMYLNLNTRVLSIYSEETQIFNFYPQRIYKEDKYDILECDARDQEGVNCLLRIYTHEKENFMIIKVDYRNFSYFYTCYMSM